ncbi:glycosyltransferase involved in cell wall biosynthesis [Microvirga lupini]|uniref:Glycosyltransferase involved in cell wall biosynthesis n=1 Tax=Microvirga lupini TaxID=420324 RepID=A0A7W4YYQ3_9HYPH|nr:glycosyltransferase [Microvirga lupini]MBB3021695.1 glycosyltransferase involved in cell wall biosynthesis [Microvirga lupini]
MNDLNRKRVALVMPIRNEERSVKETMDSVFASTRLPDEIIIADAMSTDGCIDAILTYSDRGVPIRVVQNPTIWCGGGRNAATRATSCDVIVLCDFGNTIEPNYIEKIVQPFEEDETMDIVGGLFRMRATTDFEHCVAAIHYFEDYILNRMSREEIQKILPPIVFPGGLCTAFTRRIWLAAGEQPEWLAKGQDKMFSRKVYAIGGKGMIAIDARLWHHVRRSPRELFRQLYLYGRGNGQMHFLSKHVIQLAGIYGTLSLLFILGFVSSFFAIAGLLLFAAYIWAAGIRKVVKVDGGLKKLNYIPIAIQVLLIRDIGSLLGHLLGWAEWYFVPRYKENYERYMGGLPSERILLVAPQLAGRGLFARLRRTIGAAL